MGATIYRQIMAKRRRETDGIGGPTTNDRAPPPPAPHAGWGTHPHPLRGIGEGTDGLAGEPWQPARTFGPMNHMADQGQTGSKDIALKIRH